MEKFISSLQAFREVQLLEDLQKENATSLCRTFMVFPCHIERSHGSLVFSYGQSVQEILHERAKKKKVLAFYCTFLDKIIVIPEKSYTYKNAEKFELRGIHSNWNVQHASQFQNFVLYV